MGRKAHVLDRAADENQVSPKAPPLTADGWINAQPLPNGDLTGQVSVLVFWSPTCEASLSRVAEIDHLLSRTVASHGEHLRAIAVLSPRYPFEQDNDYAHDAVARHRIGLPVVHDHALQIWSRYNPGGWPAAIVVDHRHRALGALLGLDDLDALIEATEVAVLRAASQRRPRGSTVSEDPLLSDQLTARPDHTKPDPTHEAFAWPSGLATLRDDRIAVADAGNGRVMVLELSPDRRHYRVESSFDGLDGPTRVTAWGDHGIAVSVPEQGQVLALDRRGAESQVLADDLGRPQGLTQDRDGSIVVCDAVDEQLVRILPDGALGVLAGIGFTGMVDGPAHRAELAQPVGITRTDRGLAFLDAASNNLRLLTDTGQVMSVTHNTFERYGLVDGPAHRAVLQRPTGLVARPDGTLLVADTGNNRIRVVAHRSIRTLGLAGLRRPEDVTVLSDGTVVVADTGNHRIVVADTDARSAWVLTPA